ncbi:hypothetical protein EAH78_18420 [Pseudomonas arsenicoxydans]|uniref:Uncharacterized protein n=1 Tax=Pseudomonas arsenicoxydans TaxID=702115 RepID=A0A502HT28_9PSED|nr:hypothetical protein EAH78_18420 [Pseudomonas arsenicoxydans]
MSTSPVKRLIDEMVDQLISDHLSPSRVPLNESLGLPRETLVMNIPIRLAVTMQGGRKRLEVRHDQRSA